MQGWFCSRLAPASTFARAEVQNTSRSTLCLLELLPHAGQAFGGEEPVLVHVIGDGSPAAHGVVQVHAERPRRGHALGFDGDSVEHDAGVVDPGFAEAEPLAAEVQPLAGGGVGDLDGQDVEMRVGGAPGLGVFPGLRETQRHGRVDFEGQLFRAQLNDLFAASRTVASTAALTGDGRVIDDREVGVDDLFADRGGDEQAVGGHGGRGLDGNVAHVDSVDRFPRGGGVQVERAGRGVFRVNVVRVHHGQDVANDDEDFILARLEGGADVRDQGVLVALHLSPWRR